MIETEFPKGPVFDVFPVGSALDRAEFHARHARHCTCGSQYEQECRGGARLLTTGFVLAVLVIVLALCVLGAML